MTKEIANNQEIAALKSFKENYQKVQQIIRTFGFETKINSNGNVCVYDLNGKLIGEMEKAPIGGDTIIKVETSIGELSYMIEKYDSDTETHHICLDNRKEVTDENGNKSSHGSYKEVQFGKTALNGSSVPRIDVSIVNFGPEKSNIEFRTTSHSFDASTINSHNEHPYGIIHNIHYSDITKDPYFSLSNINSFTNNEIVRGEKRHIIRLESKLTSYTPTSSAKLRLDQLQNYDFGIRTVDLLNPKTIIEFSNAFLRNNRTITFVQSVLDSSEAELPGITRIIMNNSSLMTMVFEIMKSEKNPKFSAIADALLLRGSLEECNLPGEESFGEKHR